MVSRARDVSFDRRPLRADEEELTPCIAAATFSEESVPENAAVEGGLDAELVGEAPEATRRRGRFRGWSRLGLPAAATLVLAVLVLSPTLRAQAGHDAVKLLQGKPGEVVGLAGTECRKESLLDGDFWCCSSGGVENFSQITSAPGSISCSPYCFPGEALTSVEDDRVRVPMRELVVGDRVLVQSPTAAFHYEPVLGWLHKLAGGHNHSYRYVAIEHGGGTLRASETHLLFVMGASGTESKAAGRVLVGEKLIIAARPGDAPTVREVLVVRRGQRTTQGMVAPLTASGTIVVDGAVASVYAAPSLQLHLPHSAAHAAFFPVRAFHWLGLPNLAPRADPSVGIGAYTNPLAAFLWASVRLDRLLLKV